MDDFFTSLLLRSREGSDNQNREDARASFVRPRPKARFEQMEDVGSEDEDFKPELEEHIREISEDQSFSNKTGSLNEAQVETVSISERQIEFQIEQKKIQQQIEQQSETKGNPTEIVSFVEPKNIQKGSESTIKSSETTAYQPSVNPLEATISQDSKIRRLNNDIIEPDLVGDSAIRSSEQMEESIIRPKPTDHSNNPLRLDNVTVRFPNDDIDSFTGYPDAKIDESLGKMYGSENEVQVTIGRIEVIVQQNTEARSNSKVTLPQPKKPSLSLAEYLEKRAKGSTA